MADGSIKPIEQIDIGDLAWAADPVSGTAGARPVIDLIVGDGVKDLVDIGIDGATVSATAGHPFWVDEQGEWVDAGDLQPGDELLSPDGTTVVIDTTAERSTVGRVHNLTVEGIHTYHVAADNQQVLAHNCAAAANTPRPTPARFIDAGGTIIDRSSIGTTISAQRQGRHLAGDPLFKGGGYFNSVNEAQGVLNAFHDGSANILGVSRQGHVVVKVPSITGFNNNLRAGFVDQPTSVFLIKGSSSTSIVPTNPLWTAGS